jgi:hypothetical protein
MAWQTFTKRMAPAVKEPYVTIQKRGVMSFNSAARAALGDPEAIEMLYDPDESLIGFRPVAPETHHAYPIRPSNRSEKTFMVSGLAFTKYYDIDTSVSRRYVAEMRDGVLCVDLKKEGHVVTSNRARATQANALQS